MTASTSEVRTSTSSKPRIAIRTGFAVFFILAGLNHFISPEWYIANQMPSWVPFPFAMLALTGVAEIAGGVGLLVPSVRRWAVRGLLLLLVAIFPANVHMFTEALAQSGWTSSTVGLLLRLPLQAVFCYAVWWSSTERSA